MTDTVSVVVTTYDEDPRYLREAVESVLAQTVPVHEIILVDDGSRIDNASAWERNPRISVVRQRNQGLAAARNTGWRATTSRYVVFLDADDRLVPEALATNLARFATTPDAAFVYGAYRFVDGAGRNPRVAAFVGAGDDAHAAMLRGNCVGMHATVMYRRDRLDEVGGFDATLRSCEDYELYLRLTLRHGIACGPELIAEYRRHDDNMSNDIPMMQRTVLDVLARYAPRDFDPPTWRAAYAEGVREWKSHYAFQQLYALMDAVRARDLAAIPFVGLARVAAASPVAMTRAALAGVRTVLGRRRVSFGRLRRTTPISRNFGYDRGTPVDRRYIEDFLGRHADDIHGRVLEVGDAAYTRRFGGARVTASEVLHVDPDAPGVTYVADLATGDGIPSEAFDCVVLTQTLHLVFDMASAIATLHRILKPGGVLLITVPGVSSVDTGEWGDDWLWSLTAASLGRLLRARFADDDVTVTTYGNVLTAVAFLHGLAAEELRPDEYAVEDPHYPVIVAARATRAPGAPSSLEETCSG
jgi:glycosyltransferase involved in cell wall biosynthesis/SAM-dependent methyltransferase